MLGLLLIYFIAKFYIELAKKYGKKAWPYAILGIAAYYGGTIIFGIGLGITAELFALHEIYEQPDIMLNLLSLPVGILSCWIVYYGLKKSWSSAPNVVQVNEEMISRFGAVEENKNNE